MLLSIAIPIGLLVFAAVALRRAVRGHRVGDELRCRACEYNLTGLQSTECPECGATVQDDLGNPIAVVKGSLQRSSIRITLGVVALLVVGGILLTNVGQLGSSWLRVAPTFWVTSLAEVGSQNALDELIRRSNAGTLSPAQISDVIDVCLQIQADPTVHPMLAKWMDLLGSMLVANQMTPAQESKFLKNTVTSTLAIRPVIRSGEELAVEIRCQERGPRNLPAGVDLWAHWIDGDARIGETPTHKTHGSSSGSSISGVMDSGTVTIPGAIPVELPPGEYEFVCTIKRRMYVGVNAANADPSSDPADLDVIEEFRAPVTILAADAPDPVASTPEPKLKATIRGCIEIESVKAYPGRKWNENIEAVVCIGGPRSCPPGSAAGQLGLLPSPPRNLAFRVILKADRFKQEMGSATCFGNQRMSTHTSHPIDMDNEFIDDLLNAETVTIILKSDKEVARRKIDMDEMWEGEIQFDNVPITIVGQAAKPTPTPSSQ